MLGDNGVHLLNEVQGGRSVGRSGPVVRLGQRRAVLGIDHRTMLIQNSNSALLFDFVKDRSTLQVAKDK